jgi:hypothetical protein
MSDPDLEFEEDAEDQQQSANPMRAHMRKLEAENKAFQKRLAELEAAERELVFVKAGIQPDTPKFKYFVKGYDGELTVESIRQAAEEAGFTQSTAPQVSQEKQAWERVNSAANAGESGEPLVDYAEKIRKARSADEVMQLLAQARAEAESY